MDSTPEPTITVKYLRFCSARIVCSRCGSPYLHDVLLDENGRLGRLKMCPRCQRRAILGH